LATDADRPTLSDGDGGVMSKFERLLVAGSTELPDCRCATEMHLMAIVPVPGGDTDVRRSLIRKSGAAFVMQREEMELLADRIRRSLCRWRHRRESPSPCGEWTKTTAHAEISVAFHKSKTPKSAAAGCGNTRPPLRADRLRAICWISTNERKHLRASVHTGGRRRNSLHLPPRRHSMHAYALDD
jgi:hypothetical protein